jgi:type IV secretory pathway component VirB8
VAFKSGSNFRLPRQQDWRTKMIISATLFTFLLVYAIGFMWPVKSRIYKKHSRILSNVEIKRLAASGDADAIKLKKMTNRFLILGIVFTLIFVIEKIT